METLLSPIRRRKMAEYIELEEALEALMYAMCGTGYQATAMREVRRIPAADVAPVVHGRWVNVGGGYVACSECGEEHGWEDYRASYCEDCGAKMDKEATDGD